MTQTEALRLALEFIPSISPAFICEASHHKKHEQHASNELCPHVAKQKQVYEAIKAALEAKDEPVALAWAEGYRMGISDERTSEANIGIAGFNAKVEPARENPYVTTPPQRKPLTDEEIEDFAANTLCVYSFARAIEAAHGIKGEA
jgi:hypothetical protein